MRRPSCSAPRAFSIEWMAFNTLFHLLGSLGDLLEDRAVRILGRFSTTAFASEVRVAGEFAFLDGTTVTLGVDHTVAGNPMRFERGSFELKADQEWRTSMRPRDRRITTAMTWPLLAHLAISGVIGVTDPSEDERCRIPSVFRRRPHAPTSGAVASRVGVHPRSDYDGSIEILVVFDQEDPLDPASTRQNIGRSACCVTSADRLGRRAELGSSRRPETTSRTATTTTNGCRRSSASRSRHLAATAVAEVVVTGTSIVYEDRTTDRVLPRGCGTWDSCFAREPRRSIPRPSSSHAQRWSMGSDSSMRRCRGATVRTTSGCFGPQGGPIRVVPISRPCLLASRVVLRRPVGSHHRRHPVPVAEVSRSSRDSPRVWLGCTGDSRSRTPPSAIARKPGLGSAIDPPRPSRTARLSGPLVSVRLVSADRCMRLAHRTGRGI